MNIANYFKMVYTEIFKISWIKSNQLWVGVLTVLSAILVCGLFFSIVDFLSSFFLAKLFLS